MEWKHPPRNEGLVGLKQQGANCRKRLEETSKGRLEYLVRNIAETICQQLENQQDKQVVYLHGNQSLSILLLDCDSTEAATCCKHLAHVVGSLFSCLQGSFHRYRCTKHRPEKNDWRDSDLISSLELVASELIKLLVYLQRNYAADHTNELYFVFSVKLVRVVALYVLTNLLEHTRNHTRVYQSFWKCLDEEVESCLKLGGLPSITIDVVSASCESGKMVSLCWHRILQDALDSIGKFLFSQQGKQLIKEKLQTTVLLVLRVATRIEAICSSNHSFWGFKTCLDSVEAQRSSSSTSEWIDSDDQYKPNGTFRTQLKALVLVQQLASNFGYELVSIWNIIFPHGTKDMENDSLVALLLHSPFSRIRLISAKCISEIVSFGKNFLSRMVVASWKSTDRVALPREVQHIMSVLHQSICLALFKEQHSSVLPAIVRCVSILFKIFPYHLVGTTNRPEIQSFHKDIFVALNRLVTILLDILKRDRTDDTTYSAVVSSFGNLLSIPFPYPLYEANDMLRESQSLLTLIIGDEGVLASLIDMRNKHLSSGSLLADTYSALCQVSSCYFSTIFDKLMQLPSWKQEIIDSLLYPSKNEALPFLVIKFIHSLFKCLLQDESDHHQDARFEHCSIISWEQVFEFWCCIMYPFFVAADISHLSPHVMSLVLSVVAMLPFILLRVHQPATSQSQLLFHKEMIRFIRKYLEPGNSASVRGAATCAYFRATEVSISYYGDVPGDILDIVEMTIHCLLTENVEWAFFSKATEALIDLFKLVQADQKERQAFKHVSKYLFQRGEDLAYHVLRIYPTKASVFRISIVRLLGSLVTFHDSDDRCFLLEYPCVADKVIDWLCNIVVDGRQTVNSRCLSETKLLWNACYMLSFIALHCAHPTSVESLQRRRQCTLFRSVFHRLQQEEVSHGNIKVLLACVHVLCDLSHVPIDSVHRQYVEYLYHKASTNGRESTKQWERKWRLLLEQLEKLKGLWKCDAH